MSRLSALFADRLMGDFREHLLVGIPEVAKGAASLVLGRDTPPELATGFLATVTDDISHNLASTATQSQPYPTLVALFPKGDLWVQHKRPDFGQFEHVSRLPFDQRGR